MRDRYYFSFTLFLHLCKILQRPWTKIKIVTHVLSLKQFKEIIFILYRFWLIYMISVRFYFTLYYLRNYFLILIACALFYKNILNIDNSKSLTNISTNWHLHEYFIY